MFAASTTKERSFLVTVMILLLLLLTACGNAEKKNGADVQNAGVNEAANASAGASFPRTIKHAKGETLLQTKPQKIVVTYFPYADHLYAIGEESVVSGVVGLQSLRNFPVYDAYTKEGGAKDLGSEANIEKLLDLKPDVIIGWGEDAKIYDELSKIAPTVLIPESENWQDTIGKVAEVIGEEDKAQQYVKDYNDKLLKLAGKFEQTGVKGKTAIFMMTWGKGFNYYGGVRMEPYYKGLGFAKFDGMKDWGEISLEGVGAVDPDYIFLGKDFTGKAEMTLKELEKSAVWNSLTAVKTGKLFIIDTEIVGPLAMGQMKGLEVMESIMQKL
ncbi:ABC transporter substrate-binding protein [Paenibacillus ehimensis]|uniref:ABC transporter substrate-binding protein n=1 Tax=Paenibacillus ehimensis TaxID=79264 RepID=A0ABT8VKJ3_9BACL|nr:ABC transporter substrate-binding protein [Paenibacillus ehimensis]MDO3681470.1 ABC transporter substrate-binding protein [Paenibacillus ehimensis]MEC0212040.1 ABC transporter substrate-binding protein [Paenibacillus ehimensis]